MLWPFKDQISASAELSGARTHPNNNTFPVDFAAHTTSNLPSWGLHSRKESKWLHGPCLLDRSSGEESRWLHNNPCLLRVPGVGNLDGAS